MLQINKLIKIFKIYLFLKYKELLDFKMDK